MKKYFKYILFLMLANLMLACEDVIELDLKDETPRVIIEANLDAGEGELIVLVSKSNGFYEEASQQRIENAVVSIQKEDQNERILSLNEEKAYELSGMSTISGDIFTLVVELEGVSFTSSVVVPQQVELLRIDTSLFTPPFGGGGEELLYQAFAEWQDVADSQENYRLKLYQDDILVPSTFFLYNDVSDDGELFYRPIMSIFETGFDYRIELLSMDPGSYEYYRLLSTVQAQGGGSSVPFNPQGNFDNDALGYFSVFYASHIDLEL